MILINVWFKHGFQAINLTKPPVDTRSCHLTSLTFARSRVPARTGGAWRSPPGRRSPARPAHCWRPRLRRSGGCWPPHPTSAGSRPGPGAQHWDTGTRGSQVPDHHWGWAGDGDGGLLSSVALSWPGWAGRHSPRPLHSQVATFSVERR